MRVTQPPQIAPFTIKPGLIFHRSTRSRGFIKTPDGAEVAIAVRAGTEPNNPALVKRKKTGRKRKNHATRRLSHSG